MSYLRFNHVYFALMLVSVSCAFVFAPQKSDAMREHLQGLFKPVAQPARWMAGLFSPSKSQPVDPESPTGKARPRDEVYQRNLELTKQVEFLRGQLDKFYERDNRLAKLGSLKDLCMSFNVIGADSGSREILNLVGSSFQGLRPGVGVLTEDGDLVGRVDRAGITGGTILLVTDKASRFKGTVARFERIDGRDELVNIANSTLLVEGFGNNLMRARNMRMGQLMGEEEDDGKIADKLDPRKERRLVIVNDWVMLDDDDWPRHVYRTRVGKVVKIEEQRQARGFADIWIQPVTTLTQLKEVQVVVK